VSEKTVFVGWRKRASGNAAWAARWEVVTKGCNRGDVYQKLMDLTELVALEDRFDYAVLPEGERPEDNVHKLARGQSYHNRELR
jgi:hypothetical protein